MVYHKKTVRETVSAQGEHANVRLRRLEGNGRARGRENLAAIKQQVRILKAIQAGVLEKIQALTAELERLEHAQREVQKEIAEYERISGTGLPPETTARDTGLAFLIQNSGVVAERRVKNRIDEGWRQVEIGAEILHKTIERSEREAERLRLLEEQARRDRGLFLRGAGEYDDDSDEDGDTEWNSNIGDTDEDDDGRGDPGGQEPEELQGAQHEPEVLPRASRVDPETSRTEDVSQQAVPDEDGGEGRDEGDPGARSGA